MEWYGYSLATGTLLWGPTTTAFPDGYQYFGSGRGVGQCCTAAYGNIYVQGYGGEIWCYDTANGNLIMAISVTAGKATAPTTESIRLGVFTHHDYRCLQTEWSTATPLNTETAHNHHTT